MKNLYQEIAELLTSAKNNTIIASHLKKLLAIYQDRLGIDTTDDQDVVLNEFYAKLLNALHLSLKAEEQSNYLPLSNYLPFKQNPNKLLQIAIFKNIMEGYSDKDTTLWENWTDDEVHQCLRYTAHFPNSFNPQNAKKNDLDQSSFEPTKIILVELSKKISSEPKKDFLLLHEKFFRVQQALYQYNLYNAENVKKLLPIGEKNLNWFLEKFNWGKLPFEKKILFDWLANLLSKNSKDAQFMQHISAAQTFVASIQGHKPIFMTEQKLTAVVELFISLGSEKTSTQQFRKDCQQLASTENGWDNLISLIRSSHSSTLPSNPISSCSLEEAIFRLLNDAAAAKKISAFIGDNKQFHTEITQKFSAESDQKTFFYLLDAALTRISKVGFSSWIQPFNYKDIKETIETTNEPSFAQKDKELTGGTGNFLRFLFQCEPQALTWLNICHDIFETHFIKNFPDLLSKEKDKDPRLAVIQALDAFLGSDEFKKLPLSESKKITNKLSFYADKGEIIPSILMSKLIFDGRYQTRSGQMETLIEDTATNIANDKRLKNPIQQLLNHENALAKQSSQNASSDDGKLKLTGMLNEAAATLTKVINQTISENLNILITNAEKQELNKVEAIEPVLKKYKGKVVPLVTKISAAFNENIAKSKTFIQTNWYANVKKIEAEDPVVFETVRHTEISLSLQQYITNLQSSAKQILTKEFSAPAQEAKKKTAIDLVKKITDQKDIELIKSYIAENKGGKFEEDLTKAFQPSITNTSTPFFSPKHSGVGQEKQNEKPPSPLMN